MNNNYAFATGFVTGGIIGSVFGAGVLVLGTVVFTKKVLEKYGVDESKQARVLNIVKGTVEDTENDTENEEKKD